MSEGVRFCGRRLLACCLIAAGLASHGTWNAAALAQEPAPQESEAVVYLLNPKEFPKGWQAFSAEASVPLDQVWHLNKDQDPKDAVLICTGKPDGYLRTEKEFENYELGLEWEYPSDPNGNSGILLHTLERDMIWPKSVQVQLHRPTAGSVFASNGAKLDNPLQVKDLSNPVNEWNSCLISVIDGRISVTINGKKVGEVTGCMPHQGTIGLQSEGSEIHFRKLWIRELPSTRTVSTRRRKPLKTDDPAECPTPPEQRKGVELRPWQIWPIPVRNRAEFHKLVRFLRKNDLPATFRNFDIVPDPQGEMPPFLLMSEPPGCVCAPLHQP